MLCCMSSMFSTIQDNEIQLVPKFHVHVVPNGGLPVQEHMLCFVWLKKPFQRINNLSM
jgi:hypothetical protein